MYARQSPMSMEQIQRAAPSVFATEPYEGMSDHYRFVPTTDILEGLLSHGFEVWDANQTNVRKIEKQEYARHVLRLRHPDFITTSVGEIPELIVLNSHDGTSSYQLMLGFYRMVCSNGLIVGSGLVPPTKVLHRGPEQLVHDVIEGSFEVVKEAPKAIEQIEEWKTIELETIEREALAEAAFTLRGSTIDVPSRQLLGINRFEDKGNDVWKTMNTIQENIVRGKVRGFTGKTDYYGRPKTSKVRGIKSVDADTKFNKALWKLTEKLVDAKQSGDYTKLVEAPTKELETV